MLRYLERSRLVVPERTPGGYRVYGLAELNQLRTLRQLRRQFAVELSDVAFAARLRREPQLRAAVDTWLTTSDAARAAAWVEWEQRKHERLLAA
jgi:DNA-binding transcriptional MerR regulator